MNSASGIGRKIGARKYLSVLFAIFLPLSSCPLVLLLITCSFASAARQPPNVVLIFADDLGYGNLGCYGATKIRTPNIDRIAAEGRRFTDAHSASAVCTPSRYGLLTGEYPFRAMGGKGSWGPLPSTSELIIDTESLTIGKVFQNKGYATACLGKWHLGFKKDPIGNRDRFIHNKADYNKQGKYYLSTLEISAEAARGSDKQTGVIVSPQFISKGGSMTFRVGGGSGESTYVASCPSTLRIGMRVLSGMALAF